MGVKPTIQQYVCIPHYTFVELFSVEKLEGLHTKVGLQQWFGSCGIYFDLTKTIGMIPYANF
jgi:hypothetical protein